MNDRPVKRSVTLRGHRTSVTLEPLFWQALKDIARERGLAVNALAAEIDSQRDLETGLATALRVHILEWYRSRSR